MVVGDPLQMLYDYSDDDPADLTFLETPDLHFAQCTREWHTVALQESHRLTRSMTALVNGLFDTTIESHRDGPPVEVYTVNMWKAAFVLAEVLGASTRASAASSCRGSATTVRCARRSICSAAAASGSTCGTGRTVRILAYATHKLGVSTWYAAKAARTRCASSWLRRRRARQAQSSLRWTHPIL